MLLKFISIYLMTISLVNAATLFSSKNKLPDGNADIVLQYDADEVVNTKDWMAIYKKGDDSETWSNVLTWNWVYKLKVEEPGGPFYVLPTIKLPVGDYEGRYFKNNSYDIEKSVDFSVKEVDSYLTKIRALPTQPGTTKVTTVDFDGVTDQYLPNPQDWVGIYAVDDSNDWEKVIEWAWARDVYKGWRIGDLPLAKGDYEVRYFLNNSFTTFKKSNVFVVDDKDFVTRDDVSLDIEPYIGANNNYSVRINLKDTTLNPKNWVGFFKAGKKYERDNLLKWSYNTLGQENGVIDLDLVPNSWAGQSIRAVYFENDTYEVMTEVEFTLP